MNPKYHELLEVPLEEHQLSDALECILHSILFQRLLGPVFPLEESLASTSLALPLSYCKVGHDDLEVHNKVAKGIQSFCGALQKMKSDQKTGKVFSLQLRMLTRNTQGAAVEWERWVCPFRIKARGSKSELHQCIVKNLQYTLRTSDRAIEEGYVPANDGTHCDFTIFHEVGGATIMDAVGSFLSYLTYR